MRAVATPFHEVNLGFPGARQFDDLAVGGAGNLLELGSPAGSMVTVDRWSPDPPCPSAVLSSPRARKTMAKLDPDASRSLTFFRTYRLCIPGIGARYGTHYCVQPTPSAF